MKIDRAWSEDNGKAFPDRLFGCANAAHVYQQRVRLLLRAELASEHRLPPPMRHADERMFETASNGRIEDVLQSHGSTAADGSW